MFRYLTTVAPSICIDCFSGGRANNLYTCEKLGVATGAGVGATKVSGRLPIFQFDVGSTSRNNGGESLTTLDGAINGHQWTKLVCQQETMLDCQQPASYVTSTSRSNVFNEQWPH